MPAKGGEVRARSIPRPRGTPASWRCPPSDADSAASTSAPLGRSATASSTCTAEPLTWLSSFDVSMSLPQQSAG